MVIPVYTGIGAFDRKPLRDHLSNINRGTGAKVDSDIFDGSKTTSRQKDGGDPEPTEQVKHPPQRRSSQGYVDGGEIRPES